MANAVFIFEATVQIGQSEEDMMQVQDVLISEVCEKLSEESLFELLKVIQRRERKMALRLKAGDDAQDLKMLRALRGALDEAHERKLRES